MLTHSHNLSPQIAEPKTFNKAQEIFKKNLSESFTYYEKTKTRGTENKQVTQKSNKSKFLRKLAKSVSNKNLKKFYFSYKLSFYSFLIFIKLKVLDKILRLKNNPISKNRKLFLKYYSKIIYLFLLILKGIGNHLLKTITSLNNKSFKIYKRLNIKLFLKSYKLLVSFFPINFILNLTYKTDKQFIESCYSLIKVFKGKFKWIKLNKLVFLINQNITLYSTSSNIFLKKLLNLLYYFSSIKLDKEKFYSILERINLILKIYTIPFLFLATQALVPAIDEYEYVIINPLASIIFNKIPFLIELIKLVRPIITNPVLLFWVPLSFYLIFPSGYRTLKIPYKTAFNGTIAAIFLIINYSCVLLQFMMKLAFDSIKIIKDIFFTSFLIKHLGKNKNKERDEAIKIFANLVTRYDSELRKNYYDFLLILNHRIFSHLALISLVALVYNCIYYIVHNKNPEIILVTKTALATIKNPQEEE